MKMNTMTKYSLILSCAVAASAFAADADSASVEQRQESFLEKLDNLQKNVLGFSVNGSAKAGYLRSSLSSDALADESQTAEAQAYTKVHLLFSIRPSSETVAKFGIRVNKDWNNAHREGNNEPIIDWWSYGGSVLDKHLNFELGTMRVAYTPLTIYQPLTDFLMEPDIFAEHRKDVMAERNLDGSNRRLMQGLDFTYHTFDLGPLSDIYVRGTLARLRNNGKKGDQLFFDFDTSDRYLFGGQIGAEFAGVTVGVNDAYVFDRVRSTRATLLGKAYPVDYEDNNVLSFNVGYDTRKTGKSSFNFGANAEVALSSWNARIDEMNEDSLKILSVYTPDSIYAPDGSKILRAYLTYKDSVDMVPRSRDLGELNGKLGVHVDAYASYEAATYDVTGKVNFVMTDKGFQSELAMSPVSMGLTSVLNSNAIYDDADPTLATLLQGVRSGALENMYFSFYESVPLAAYNMIIDESSGAVQKVDGVVHYVQSDTFELFNNYKYGQFYRNGYSYKTLKRSELMALAMALDPATDIALPYGYATPNRTGGDLDLTFKWNDAVTVRAVGGYYMAKELDKDDSLSFESGTSYMRFGGGASAELGSLFGLNRMLKLSASYVQTKESDYLERTSSNLVAGLAADIYGPVAFLGGFQYLKNSYGVPYAGMLNSISEMLILVGPKVKIATGAYFTVQYGIMNNTIDYNKFDKKGKVVGSETMDYSKNLIMADVKVDF